MVNKLKADEIIKKFISSMKPKDINDLYQVANKVVNGEYYP